MKVHQLPVVYVITSPDFEFIKIGMSTSFKKRLRVLQVGCPFDLDMWLFIYTEVPREIEKYLHACLAHCWVRGEWFSPSEKDLDFLGDYADKKNKEARAAYSALL